MREEYMGYKVVIKLSQPEIMQMMGGKILRGYKADVGMDVPCVEDVE